MIYRSTIGHNTFVFDSLRDLLARATPYRSGDVLAGVAANSAIERVAAQFALADVPLTDFLNEPVIPYETDEITRLIYDNHCQKAFQIISHHTVGSFRDWLLSADPTVDDLRSITPGLTPEMAAAAVKIMRLQDLIVVGQKCSVVTKFRTTIGLPNRLSTRLQPNHPTDDLLGIAASLLDGLLLGSGDAVIGINPATDSVDAYIKIVAMLDEFRRQFDMPVQSCVLSHITTAIKAMESGAPVDIVFQSIAGSEAANKGFGIDIKLLDEAYQMAVALNRGTVGNNVMYFETGQGSALSSGSHHGVDQQTIEARAYAVARRYSPLLVNTVVGFIGPEYLYNGKQITRAGLEDHCCGKLLGLPMGCDVCYTNHAEADQDDMDSLLTLLGVAGCTFIMGVPGADDIMLNYQSTSFHDALYARKVLGKRAAPEFEQWLTKMGICDKHGTYQPSSRISAIEAPIMKALTGGTDSSLVANGQHLSESDVWTKLKTFTSARIGIEVVGISQPTRAHLAFQQDHASARDAVFSSLQTETIHQELKSAALKCVTLHSRAESRTEYLVSPERGRLLDDRSKAALHSLSGYWDIAFVLADGLSASAIQESGPELVQAIIGKLADDDWLIAPIAVVEQGRVAIGDDIAQTLGAGMVVVLIGERPGLGSSDSIGAYITWNPIVGTLDSERNCVSNIRAGGLPIGEASAKIAGLMSRARTRMLTGVGLKEESLAGPTRMSSLTSSAI